MSMSLEKKIVGTARLMCTWFLSFVKAKKAKSFSEEKTKER